MGTASGSRLLLHVCLSLLCADADTSFPEVRPGCRLRSLWSCASSATGWLASWSGGRWRNGSDTARAFCRRQLGACRIGDQCTQGHDPE